MVRLYALYVVSTVCYWVAMGAAFAAKWAERVSAWADRKAEGV